MPYTHKAFILTVVGGAITLVLSLILSVTMAFWFSYTAAQHNKHALCNAVSVIARKPTAPRDTPLYRRELEGYQSLARFKITYGCD